MKSKLISVIILVLIMTGCSKTKNNRRYTGTLEGTTIKIPATLPGKIDKSYITEGQEIIEDDLIAVIDTTLLFLEKNLLLKSLPELEENLKKADITLKQTEDELIYINEKLERTKKLYETESLSQQKFDDIVNLQKKSLAAKELAVSNKKSIIIKKDQLLAKIKILNKKISDGRIESPSAGIITKLYRNEGEAIGAYMPIAELMDIHNLEIKIYLSASKLTEVKIGNQVMLDVDGSKEQYKGLINWISPTAEFTPKEILTPDNRSALVYAVTVKVENPQKILKNGMPAEVFL